MINKNTAIAATIAAAKAAGDTATIAACEYIQATDTMREAHAARNRPLLPMEPVGPTIAEAYSIAVRASSRVYVATGDIAATWALIWQVYRRIVQASL